MQKQIFFSFVLVMMLLGKVKAQHNNPFGNALIPDMIADASIQEINGVFYCLTPKLMEITPKACGDKTSRKKNLNHTAGKG